MKPKLLRTCGGCWTSWPALPGLPSPDEAHQHQIPGPRKVESSRPRVPPAHLHRPMEEPRCRHQRRPLLRRSRTTSGWPPSTPRRSSPTSMSSSRSLTSLLLFYVSILRFGIFRGFGFLGGLFVWNVISSASFFRFSKVVLNVLSNFNVSLFRLFLFCRCCLMQRVTSYMQRI